MRIERTFLSLPITAALLLAWPSACSDSRELDTEPEADASLPPSQTDASPPPNDIGGDDVDARAPDAAPPKPLEVACEGGVSCYVGIFGNGGQHVCGLRQDETVRCWGRDGWNDSDGYGALGRGTRTSVLEGATPVAVADLTGVTQLSVGPNLGSCARTSDGAVYCWGKNDMGQLGPAPSAAGLAHATRVDGLPPVDHVEVGATTSCAITTADRALYCWGRDSAGKYAAPRKMEEFSPPVKQLAIGTRNNADAIVVLLEGDMLAAMGSNLPSRETSIKSNVVVKSGVVQIAPFAYATSDGTFRRWLPAEGTLYVPSFAPIIDVKISGATAPVGQTSPYAAVQGGALTSTGRLFRWGPNVSGALGRDPDSTIVALYPVEVTQVARKVVSFATTTASTCALLVDGDVECWGSNAFGELGRGSVDRDPHPEPEVIR